MQITTATRTVEIYANTEAGITYRNTKDGVAYGPVRTANRATAKAGSVGREILDAIDAITAEEEAAERAAAPAEVVATITETVAPVAPVATQTVATQTVALNSTQAAQAIVRTAAEWVKGTRVQGTDSEGRARVGTVERGGDGVTRTGRNHGRTFVCVVWDADDSRGLRRRIEGPYTDTLTRIGTRASAADTIRRAVNLKW